MVVNVGVVGVVSDGSFEIAKCGSGVAQFHVDRGNLDP
jgi:hypothetical protein